MNNIYESIFTFFSTTPHSSFYNAIEGRLEYGQAPSHWVDNYAVYFPYVIVNDDTFDAEINDMNMQISVFSSDRSACGDIGKACLLQFDGALIPSTEFHPFKVIRGNITPMMLTTNELLWFEVIEFFFKFQKI